MLLLTAWDIIQHPKYSLRTASNDDAMPSLSYYHYCSPAVYYPQLPPQPLAHTLPPPPPTTPSTTPGGVTQMVVSVVPYGFGAKTWNNDIPSTVVDIHVRLLDAVGDFQYPQNTEAYHINLTLMHDGEVLHKWEKKLSSQGTQQYISINIGLIRNNSIPYLLNAVLISPRQATHQATQQATQATQIIGRTWFTLGDSANDLHGDCADILPLNTDTAWLGLSPPVNVPSHLCSDFSLNGTVPFERLYMDDSNTNEQKNRSYRSRPRETIDNLIEGAQLRKVGYYEETDRYLYSALDRYPVTGKSVLVVGSTHPWYEAILLAFGASNVVTLEYNELNWDHPKLTTVTVAEWNTPGSLWSARRFDVVVSISSIEHDGLGRYGDPIDPNADLKAMQRIRTQYLKRTAESFLILSVPVKQDLVLWNAGRHYGRVRLPILGRGWDLQAFIHTDTKLLTRTTRDNTAEPVMVLFPVWSDTENRGDGGDDLEEKWNEINQGELMQLPSELL
jgi:hypothetical protein